MSLYPDYRLEGRIPKGKRILEGPTRNRIADVSTAGIIGSKLLTWTATASIVSWQCA